MWFKCLSPFFSFPTLKKNKSLFHKAQIAFVLEKVKRVIRSFYSSNSFNKSDGSESSLFLKERQVQKGEERIPNPVYIVLKTVQCTAYLWNFVHYGCTVLVILYILSIFSIQSVCIFLFIVCLVSCYSVYCILLSGVPYYLSCPVIILSYYLVYPIIMCGLLSCVSYYLVYPIIMCILLSCVSYYHVYPIILCILLSCVLSCVPYYHVYPIILCILLSCVSYNLVYPIIMCILLSCGME